MFDTAAPHLATERDMESWLGNCSESHFWVTGNFDSGLFKWSLIADIEETFGESRGCAALSVSWLRILICADP